jgi:hypothetical protein
MHNEPIQTEAGQSGGPQFREAFELLIKRFLAVSVTVISGARFPSASERVIGARSSSRPANRVSSTSLRRNCRAKALPIVAIPEMGTPEMQIT